MSEPEIMWEAREQQRELFRESYRFVLARMLGITELSPNDLVPVSIYLAKPDGEVIGGPIKNHLMGHELLEKNLSFKFEHNQVLKDFYIIIRAFPCPSDVLGYVIRSPSGCSINISTADTSTRIRQECFGE